MEENVTKTALRNIEIEMPKKAGAWEKVKKHISFTKGLTLNMTYSQVWEKIDKRFYTRKPIINLADHAPIITINADKDTEHAERFVDIIKDKYDLSELINVGLIGDEMKYIKTLEAMMFIRLVRIFPEYCRQKAVKDFEEFIVSEKAKEFFKELFSISGTIKDTDMKIDKLIRRTLEE